MPYYILDLCDADIVDNYEQVALARFLAKWTPRDAPKPVDR